MKRKNKIKKWEKKNRLKTIDTKKVNKTRSCEKNTKFTENIIKCIEKND